MSSQDLVQSNVSIHIENVVATTTLNQKIDIKKTIQKFNSAQYEPKKFPGVIIRQNSPRSVILFFESGSIVCTGAKSEEMTISAIQNFISKIRSKSKNYSQNSKIKIENMVASCDLGDKIHLEQTARVLPRSIYEPDQFPAVIHRLSYPNTVALIFASGRMVCTGARSTREIQISTHTMLMELEKRNLIAHEKN